ncbi:DUF47 family protein [Clostridia bacterium]|nr:DUF47 family protein [Clostridia bacterium]
MFGRKRKGYDYFESMANLSDYTVQAANYLSEVLNNYKKSNLSKARAQMHELENAADEAKTDMMKRLIDEFLPPLERDDIISLSHYIDDVTDAVEEVMIHYDVFGYIDLRKDSLRFVKLIQASCESMNKALWEMKNYEKSELLFKQIKEVKELKAQGDDLYVHSLRQLYQENNAPEIVLAYSEIFMRMKSCCDRCKLVVNDIERIVMKNL